MKFRRGLFAKTFTVTALILSIFAFAGFAINDLMMRQWGDSARLRPPQGPGEMGDPGFPKMGKRNREPPGTAFSEGQPLDHPSVLTARILGASSPEGRPKVLAELAHNDERSGASYVLTDAQGAVIAPQGGKLPFDWGALTLPSGAYDYVPVEPGDGPPSRTLVRLAGEPAQYLYVELQRPNAIPLKIPLLMFGSYLLAILLGAWVSVMVLFHTLRRNLLSLDGVLEDLRNGNLKARLPSGGYEELGGTTERFNRMIDEIERLVSHLREVESSRRLMMQDLAHDLRTPVASLKNLLETLRGKDETLGKELRAELLGLANSEIAYFEILVEDLLMLAQINEPNYQAARQEVQMNDLLNDAADLSFPPVDPLGRGIRLERDLPAEPIVIRGDERLLKRMMRNALDNAFRSASSRVRLAMRLEGAEGAVILIEDDGPGFPPEMLSVFGEKRIGSSRSRSKDGVLRAGLGAVIMKTIARIHGGTLKAENLSGENGKISGARVGITLPI